MTENNALTFEELYVLKTRGIETPDTSSSEDPLPEKPELSQPANNHPIEESPHALSPDEIVIQTQNKLRELLGLTDVHLDLADGKIIFRLPDDRSYDFLAKGEIGSVYTIKINDAVATEKHIEAVLKVPHREKWQDQKGRETFLGEYSVITRLKAARKKMNLPEDYYPETILVGGTENISEVQIRNTDGDRIQGNSIPTDIPAAIVMEYLSPEDTLKNRIQNLKEGDPSQSTQKELIRIADAVAAYLSDPFVNIEAGIIVNDRKAKDIYVIDENGIDRTTVIDWNVTQEEDYAKAPTLGKKLLEISSFIITFGNVGELLVEQKNAGPDDIQKYTELVDRFFQNNPNNEMLEKALLPAKAAGLNGLLSLHRILEPLIMAGTETYSKTIASLSEQQKTQLQQCLEISKKLGFSDKGTAVPSFTIPEYSNFLHSLISCKKEDIFLSSKNSLELISHIEKQPSGKLLEIDEKVQAFYERMRSETNIPTIKECQALDSELDSVLNEASGHRNSEIYQKLDKIRAVFSKAYISYQMEKMDSDQISQYIQQLTSLGYYQPMLYNLQEEVINRRPREEENKQKITIENTNSIQTDNAALSPSPIQTPNSAPPTAVTSIPETIKTPSTPEQPRLENYREKWNNRLLSIKSKLDKGLIFDVALANVSSLEELEIVESLVLQQIRVSDDSIKESVQSSFAKKREALQLEKNPEQSNLLTNELRTKWEERVSNWNEVTAADGITGVFRYQELLATIRTPEELDIAAKIILNKINTLVKNDSGFTKNEFSKLVEIRRQEMVTEVDQSQLSQWQNKLEQIKFRGEYFLITVKDKDARLKFLSDLITDANTPEELDAFKIAIRTKISKQNEPYFDDDQREQLFDLIVQAVVERKNQIVRTSNT